MRASRYTHCHGFERLFFFLIRITVSWEAEPPRRTQNRVERVRVDRGGRRRVEMRK